MTNPVRVIKHHVLRNNVVRYRHHFVHNRVLHWNSIVSDGSVFPASAGQQTNDSDVYVDSVINAPVKFVQVRWNGSAWELPDSFNLGDYMINKYDDTQIQYESPQNPKIVGNLRWNGSAWEFYDGTIPGVVSSTKTSGTDSRTAIPHDLVSQLKSQT